MTYIYRVLRDGPTGLWSLDSTPLKDSSGYGKDATFTGSPTTTRPIVAAGIAAQQITSTASISYPVSDIMISGRSTRAFSLEAWIKPTNGTTKILARNNSGLFLDGLKLRFSVDMGTLVSAEYKNLRAGNVYHVVGVYDGEGISLYLNGELVDSEDIPLDTFSAGFVDATTTLTSSTSSTLVMDTPATYNYALSKNSVSSHYAMGTAYPEVINLSTINGGKYYEFSDEHVGTYRKQVFDSSGEWNAGMFAGSIVSLDGELVSLYSDTTAQWESGVWTYQESFESNPDVSLVGSRITWDSAYAIQVDKSDDGGANWTSLSNGSQICGSQSLTDGYGVSIRVTIPASTEQIIVKSLTLAFYSSMNIKGSDEDLPAVVLNPAGTTLADDSFPAVSFNDNAGVNLAGTSSGLSINQDTDFGGYFAVEMTVKVPANVNNATILYLDMASAQPQITTNASGQWTFSNLTGLYVDGVAVTSPATITPGVWHHVIATFAESLGNVYVGNNVARTAGYAMRIGHLATYSDAVSSSDALAIYKAWTGAPATVIADESTVYIYDAGSTPSVGMGMGPMTLASPSQTTLVPSSSTGWKYLEIPMTDTTDRSITGFNDAGWAVGKAPFGEGPPGTVRAGGTMWHVQSGIWLRRRINCGTDGDVTISGFVDNIVAVYWNGELIGSGDWSNTTGHAFSYTVPQNKVLPSNMLAVRGQDDLADYGSGEGNILDVSVVGPALPPFKGYSHIWSITSGG